MAESIDFIAERLCVLLALGEYDKFDAELKQHPETARCVIPYTGSILHEVASLGRVKAVVQLLDAGADANSRGGHRSNYSPLACAWACDESPDVVEIVRLLLAHGADPDADRAIISAINHRSDEATRLALVKLLVEAGADVNRVYDVYGDPNNTFTALEWAEGTKSVADYLRSKGAADRPDRPPPAPPPGENKRRE